jgi:hypothetical protein
MSEEAKKGDWVVVESVGSEAEAALVAGFLESEGIPARVVDRSFHLTPTPEDEDLSPIGVAVPGERLREAEQALARRESAFPNARKDAEAVLTDEGPTHVDPDAPDRDPEADR